MGLRRVGNPNPAFLEHGDADLEQVAAGPMARERPRPPEPRAPGFPRRGSRGCRLRRRPRRECRRWYVRGRGDDRRAEGCGLVGPRGGRRDPALGLRGGPPGEFQADLGQGVQNDDLGIHSLSVGLLRAGHRHHGRHVLALLTEPHGGQAQKCRDALPGLHALRAPRARDLCAGQGWAIEVGRRRHTGGELRGGRPRGRGCAGRAGRRRPGDAAVQPRPGHRRWRRRRFCRRERRGRRGGRPGAGGGEDAGAGCSLAARLG
mmetsp:Transcript_95825/g.310548  ORF Transcript_95825/g.310548 Transcript_95825/m.310548 type:complete len:261 (+) Transcript_95825:457-1239(+)